MKTLTLKWQRLVQGGETCPRCQATGEEVKKAVAALTSRLSPLGIGVTLEMAELEVAAFQRDPGQSNRLWIEGRPLEEWLAGNVGHSVCGGVCGDAECRTLELEGKIYEAIPAALIVQAGIQAAARLLSPPGGPCGCGAPGCSDGPGRPGSSR
jgi:anti-sigma factor RsiW